MGDIKSIEANLIEQRFLNSSFQEKIKMLIPDLLCYRVDEKYLVRKHEDVQWKYCADEDVLWKQYVKINLDIAFDNKYLAVSLKERKSENEALELKEKLVRYTQNHFTSFIPAAEISNLPDPSAAREDAAEDDGSKPKKLYRLPPSCVAFANGVWDFARGKWLFRYNVLPMPEMNSRLLDYEPVDSQTAKELGLERECAKGNPFCVMWYFKDGEFKELFDKSVFEMKPQAFYDMLRERNETHPSLCFELVSNMSHDVSDRFDIGKFEHICQIMGYAIDSQRVQKFVILIGSGGNGKNALFDNGFGRLIQPKPFSLSLGRIEEGKFLGGLETHQHNFSFETKSGHAYSLDKLKELTGGSADLDDKYVRNHSVDDLNVKFIFSCNDVDSLKLNDSSAGFDRRKNFLELFYQYDSEYKFMQRNPDYYKADLGIECANMVGNPEHVSMFCYMAMYGIYRATNGFKSSDWKFCEDDYTPERFSGADPEVQYYYRSLPFDTLSQAAAYLESVVNDKSVEEVERLRCLNTLRYEFAVVEESSGKKVSLTDLESYREGCKERNGKLPLSEFLKHWWYEGDPEENSARESPFYCEMLDERKGILWIGIKILNLMKRIHYNESLNGNSNGYLLSKFRKSFPKLKLMRIRNRAFVKYDCLKGGGELWTIAIDKDKDDNE